jgi:hypothetical protein
MRGRVTSIPTDYGYEAFVLSGSRRDRVSQGAVGEAATASGPGSRGVGLGHRIDVGS